MDRDFHRPRFSEPAAENIAQPATRPSHPPILCSTPFSEDMQGIFERHIIFNQILGISH